jgi:hypothetical protein
MGVDIFKSSRRALARNQANSPKVAVLFLLNAVGWLILDAIGYSALNSPLTLLTLVPHALIYLAERLGKIRWFIGMTGPTFFVLLGMVVIGWVLNSKQPLPDAIAYAVFGVWIFSLCFMGYRIWTFEPSEQPTNEILS